MRKISAYTNNQNILLTLKSSRKLTVELNSEAPTGEVCVIDCSTSLDNLKYMFHPCIAIVAQSDCSALFDADYIIQMPFVVDTLEHIVELLIAEMEGYSYEKSVMSTVNDILTEIGMDVSRNGFNYAVRAVTEYIICNGRQKFKDIFSSVAQKNNTTTAAVERALRTAVEKTWQCGDIDKLYALFGNSIRPDKGKPSNAEFVAMIAQQFNHRKKNCIYSNKIYYALK